MFIYSLLFILLSLSVNAKTFSAHLNDKRSSYKENEVIRTIFKHDATGATIDYVTNSGICETTPGVNQYSGYLSVGTNENMWFWFFEARNRPTTAPLSVWFNGGPGCSSMVGLFQENGPCHFENGSDEPSLNPYSWNEYSNMLYIDQPIGVGFSYGENNVNSTTSSAVLVWKLVQAFYAQFPQYENRTFGVFTESYGGHYGPEFVSYFQSQNMAIKDGRIKAQVIDVKVLAINNGWYDSAIQTKALIDYAYKNNYRPLINSTEYNEYIDVYNKHCLPALQNCTSKVGQDASCAFAFDTCSNYVEGPILNTKDFGIYDVRAPRDDPNPITTYLKYLNSSQVVNAIGAKVSYTECANDLFEKFSETGDNARSYISTLSSVVQSGVKTLIWAGDADWICNWYGGLDVAQNINYSESTNFKTQKSANYTINGKVGGEFKTAGNLSWLRVYGGGHEVPYYQPELALQVFRQMFELGILNT
ncbi:putative carboxypeptidase s1 protein [Erysiphe necator]|uniref:Carboxypeptidase n=1 Tax=Uncinula necator TaxID=52586 RepID=A0A0B1P6F7_UNCNE|nr:putative carboxypeptidase s1 protein [Erysiphe necator]